MPNVLNLSDITRILSCDIETATTSNQSGIYQLQKAFYGAIKAVNSQKKETKVEYHKVPLNQFLNNIGAKLFSLIDGDKSDYWVIRFNKRNPNFSCIEFDIIQVFSKLKFPMDFPVYLNDGSVSSLAVLLAKICDRSNHFISKPNMRVDASVITYALNELTNFDINSAPVLQQSVSVLIGSLISRAYNESNNWGSSHKIHLLWANAIHSLQPDDSYQSILSRHQILTLLRAIENDLINGRFILNEQFTRQLFQVYSANLFKDAGFPQTLLDQMRKFIPVFKSNSHGSQFETRVKREFFWPNGIHNHFKTNPIYASSTINFDNPIDDEAALETDFLLVHPETNTKLATQIDGSKYHKYLSFDQSKKKNETLRSRFRDYCFRNIGYHVVHISDTDNNNYKESLIDCINMEFIVPAFDVHQKNKIKKADSVLLELETIYGQFEMVRSDYRDKLSKLDSALKQLRLALIGAKKLKNIDLEQSIHNLIKFNTAVTYQLQLNYVNMENKIASLNSRSQKHQDEIESFPHSNILNEMRFLVDYIANTQESIEQFKIKADSSQNELESLRAEKNKLNKAKNRKKKEEKVKLQGEINRNSLEIARLEREVDKSKEELENLNLELKSLKKRKEYLILLCNEPKLGDEMIPKLIDMSRELKTDLSLIREEMQVLFNDDDVSSLLYETEAVLVDLSRAKLEKNKMDLLNKLYRYDYYGCAMDFIVDIEQSLDQAGLDTIANEVNIFLDMVENFNLPEEDRGESEYADEYQTDFYFQDFTVNYQYHINRDRSCGPVVKEKSNNLDKKPKPVEVLSSAGKRIL